MSNFKCKKLCLHLQLSQDFVRDRDIPVYDLTRCSHRVVLSVLALHFRVLVAITARSILCACVTWCPCFVFCVSARRTAAVVVVNEQ